MSSSDVLRPDAQVHFGVFFQGVNHTTIWSDPASGSQIDFETFRQVVTRRPSAGCSTRSSSARACGCASRTARSWTSTSPAGPTRSRNSPPWPASPNAIGLVATQNTTYNEPGDLARRLAGLDILSGGRAGWNAVTTDNAWTGENFRRGGFLDHELRYGRAGQFIRTARAIWDRWGDDAIASPTAGEFSSDPNAVRHVDRSTSQFDISLDPTLPRSPQGHPVIFQAGDSPTGRDFAAANADVIFSRHGTHFDDALTFANDIRARLLAAGRPADDIRILPGTQIVLAEKASEVEEKRRWVLEGQYTGQTALSLVGLVWGRDLSDRDPDGPLPEFDPVPAPISATRGAARDGNDPIAIAKEWRALAEAKNLSLRQVAIETSARSGFVGTPGQVADELARWVHAGATDGFNISPYIVPGGLDEVVDRLVPELQERGVYRTEYTSRRCAGTSACVHR